MTSTDQRTGGCQCGKIRYQLHGEARMLYACHCTDCQKQSSSAFGLSLIIDAEQIEFTRGEDSLRRWDTRGETGGIKRCTFCPDCGSRIYHGGDGYVSIKAGSLDETGDLHPVAHIWLRSAQPWISIDPAQYRCYEQEPEDREELEALWRAQRETA